MARTSERLGELMSRRLDDVRLAVLRRDQVSSPDGVDADQWRAEIRAKARADKIRVITIRDGDRAIATRQRSIPKDQELAELTRELDRSLVLRTRTLTRTR